MAETANAITMDRLITGLGDIRATTESEGQDICQAAVNILFVLKEEGRRPQRMPWISSTTTSFRAKSMRSSKKKHLTAGRPFLKDGVWHCPDCNGRCRSNNSFCHRCGKKLSWR